jgi:KEOPS complex subunit Cgi121
MMPDSQKNIAIIGGIGRVDSADEFIEKARDFIKEDYALLQFLDADKVLGKEHILSAMEHADRAFERGDNISSTKAMEILIYAAGEPQISNALKRIGLKDGCERIAIIAQDNLNIEDLLEHMNLKRDDEVLEFSEQKLKAFGISEKEISAVEKSKVKDLILERVAMVDVKK